MSRMASTTRAEVGTLGHNPANEQPRKLDTGDSKPKTSASTSRKTASRLSKSQTSRYEVEQSLGSTNYLAPQCFRQGSHPVPDWLTSLNSQHPETPPHTAAVPSSHGWTLDCEPSRSYCGASHLQNNEASEQGVSPLHGPRYSRHGSADSRFSLWSKRPPTHPL